VILYSGYIFLSRRIAGRVACSAFRTHEKQSHQAPQRQAHQDRDGSPRHQAGDPSLRNPRRHLPVRVGDHEAYGIGRTPFREACNRLHREGLLEVVPRRGYLVPVISFETVRDLFELRFVLESAIAELAATRATEAQIEEMEALVKRGAPAGGSESEQDENNQINTRSTPGFTSCWPK